jgi:hypothetical protein
VVVKTLDKIHDRRDAGIALIGGFHSRMEKEYPSLLLRAAQLAIVYPARSMKKVDARRVECPCAEGHLPILSPFGTTPRRISTQRAARKQFVVDIADALFDPYASARVKTLDVIERSIANEEPIYSLNDAENCNPPVQQAFIRLDSPTGPKASVSSESLIARAEIDVSKADRGSFINSTSMPALPEPGHDIMTSLRRKEDFFR